ncbi:response regulator transcription factor [Streptomyces sp. Je 1-4]|uniref:response regulator n=1 Tax=Streptomyces TaxID=1883 RepID=UPI002180CA62|nr:MULTISPECIES: response regulator transcription factor [unclassified Streptomyces]UYB41019.1 response regulator transcription factor [Streptomyces sp. Je 1-4]UZQ37181.1 response regulator transcription factor [Streptomyces sp. Je 1-4] [Streptomyces sp. Je 1-4 4N24]UZQ44598.1 response regulator transcription factor [Streptomyces sp. Je 1-4] [Streptomyces sp. Je 1-4 4N24_ara]
MADDHTVVRQGIVALLSLESDIEIVGEAQDGTSVVSATTALRPDVVLMDLRMPGGGGIAATRKISSLVPDCRVLVLTTYDNDASIVGAIEAGAIGYLLKSTSTPELVAGVRSAAVGRSVITPAVTLQMARRRSGTATSSPTPREIEILALVAQGRTNARIAEQLGIGEATVKTHLLSAFRKLGVSDRTEAVMAALSAGLISLPG